MGCLLVTLVLAVSTPPTVALDQDEGAVADVAASESRADGSAPDRALKLIKQAPLSVALGLLPALLWIPTLLTCATASGLLLAYPWTAPDVSWVLVGSACYLGGAGWLLSLPTAVLVGALGSAVTAVAAGAAAVATDPEFADQAVVAAGGAAAVGVMATLASAGMLAFSGAAASTAATLAFTLLVPLDGGVPRQPPGQGRTPTTMELSAVALLFSALSGLVMAQGVAMILPPMAAGTGYVMTRLLFDRLLPTQLASASRALPRSARQRVQATDG